MEELDNVVDEEKDLSCSTDLNIKEDKKKTLIMRSGYLIVALLLGIFTELYLAVIGLVAITFFMPDLLHVSKMKLKQSVKKILLVVLCVLLIFGIRWTFYEVRFAIYVKEFREDYGIHLAKEENEQKVKITYRLKDVTDTKNLCDKLSGVLKCLDQLPEGLMEEIKEPIYMETKDGTEQLVPEGEIQIIFSDTIGGKAAGIVEFGIGWDMMALDANSNRSIDKLFYHEFSHLLDKRNSWKSFASDSRYRKEWGTVNPNGFKYGYENYDYVMGEVLGDELIVDEKLDNIKIAVFHLQSSGYIHYKIDRVW